MTLIFKRQRILYYFNGKNEYIFSNNFNVGIFYFCQFFDAILFPPFVFVVLWLGGHEYAGVLSVCAYPRPSAPSAMRFLRAIVERERQQRTVDFPESSDGTPAPGFLGPYFFHVRNGTRVIHLGAGRPVSTVDLGLGLFRNYFFRVELGSLT